MPVAIGCQADGRTQQSLQNRDHRGQGKGVDFLSFGSPQMGHRDDACAFIQKQLQGRNSCLDSSGISYRLRFVEGHVEIEADNRPQVR